MLTMIRIILLAALICNISKPDKIASSQQEYFRNLDSCNEFSGTISIKMNDVPSLLSTHDQGRLAFILERFIKEKNPKISNMKVGLLRQIFEKERSKKHGKNLLLIYTVSGCDDDEEEASKLNLQRIFGGKNKKSFIEWFQEEFRYDSFFSNTTKIEVVKTPEIFTEDELEATSYAKIESKDEDESTESEGVFGNYENYLHLSIRAGALVVGTVFILFGFAFKLRSIANKDESALDKRYAFDLKSDDDIWRKRGHRKNDDLKTDVEIWREEKLGKILPKEEKSKRKSGSSVNKHPWKKKSSSPVKEAIIKLNPEIDAGSVDGSLSTTIASSSYDESVLAEKKKQSELKSKDEKSFRGECFAPPGKLGVAVDTVDGVPVVYKVKSGSPLYGALQSMDRIVAIDEVDCRSMTSAEVTKLMVARMRSGRKITYERGGSVKEDDDVKGSVKEDDDVNNIRPASSL